MLKLLENDLRILAEEVESVIASRTAWFNRRIRLAALEESAKSIELAGSVKTLSQLAFVFLPLTFSATLFGMNLREFGQGTAPAWSVIPATTAVCLFTGAFFFGFKWYGSIALSIKDLDYRREWRAATCLFRESMLDGVLVFLFLACYSGPRSSSLRLCVLEDLDLLGFRIREPHGRIPFSMLRHDKTIIAKFFLKAFLRIRKKRVAAGTV